MVNLRGLALGFVLGAIPGIVGLALTAIFVGSGVENAIVFLLFASIGGALGALTTIPLAFIRRRRQQASPNSKRYSMVAGLLVCIVPGVNGLVYTAIFVRCGDLGPGIHRAVLRKHEDCLSAVLCLSSRAWRALRALGWRNEAQSSSLAASAFG